jgi:DNA repair exonuclease SbcCD ATPase subunit
MRLNIKSLELSRFRSYVEPSGVIFPETGLVLVRGNGSGAGKSSLFMAIYDAIGICQVPATQLKSWHAESPRRVALHLTADDKDIVIRRGENQALLVDNTEKPLDALPVTLGVKDLEWLLPLTYRPQNGGSFFLSLTDADKKSFLSGVLGLDALEKAFDDSQEKTPKLLSIKESAANRLASVTGILQATQGQLQTMEECEGVEPLQVALRSAEQVAAEKSAALSRATKAAPELSPEEAQRVEELRRPVPQDPMTAQFQAKMKGLDQQESGLKRDWSATNAAYLQATQQWSLAAAKAAKAEAELKAMRTQEANLVRDLQALTDGTCPTCLQPWHDHEEESDRQAKLAALREKIAAQEVAIQQTILSQEKPEPPAPLDLSQSQKMRDALRRRLDQLALAQKQKALENAAAADAILAAAKADIHRRISQLTVEHTEALTVVNDTRHRLQAAVRRKSLVDALASVQAEVVQAEVALQNAVAEIKKEDDFRALIGPKGFLGAIFDEVLAEISAATNDMLALMPNVAHVSLHLSSTKTAAASKKQQKVITPIFRSHGHEISGAAWTRVFSGGQVTAIQLALDLAVAQVLGQRTGLEAGWLILDEPFVGLPAAETEQVMEVLRGLAEKRLILVVDHGTESQQMFSQTIDVVNENGRSRIQ